MGLRLGIGGEKKRNGTGGKAARSRLSGGHVVVCLVSFGVWWIWDRGIRNTFRNTRGGVSLFARFLGDGRSCLWRIRLTKGGARPFADGVVFSWGSGFPAGAVTGIVTGAAGQLWWLFVGLGQLVTGDVTVLRKLLRVGPVRCFVLSGREERRRGEERRVSFLMVPSDGSSGDLDDDRNESSCACPVCVHDGFSEGSYHTRWNVTCNTICNTVWPWWVCWLVTLDRG